MNVLRTILALSFLLVLSGCSGVPFFGSKNIGKPGKSVGQYKVGSPYTINGVRYKPQEYDRFVETGIASWYGPGFHGKSTANGERFDTHELTAAHRVLPMPSLVRVTNLENGRSLVLRVNDRGPYAHNRIIDVSQKGAELLGFKNKGTAKVRVELMARESKNLADLAKKGLSTQGKEMAYNGYKRQQHGHLPVPPEPPVIRQASVNAPMKMDDGTELPGHLKGGVFYPDAVLKQTPVQPTTIFVQAGSFSNQASADMLARKLKSFGEAHVYPANVNGRQYFRVRLAARTIAEADRLMTALTKSGYPDSLIVVE